VADHAHITGGPADGLATSPGARFVWLEVVVRKRAERTPGAGLYELRDGKYEYVGAGGEVCVCGAVYRRGPDGIGCPLCGSAALARTAPHA
jgi:hypothetical protein